MATELRQPASEVAPPRESPYEVWIRNERVPIFSGFGISGIKDIKLSPWDRLGGRGAFLQLTGLEGLVGLYTAEIPPGASLVAEKHLYDEIMYVLSGHGATEVWNSSGSQPGGSSTTFEWAESSVFAPPLNVWHRLHNGSGNEPARVVGITTAPLMMDLLRNTDFIFSCDYRFAERYDGAADYFAARDIRLPRPSGRSFVLRTNLIADVRKITVNPQGPPRLDRRSLSYEISGNALNGHMEDWPPGLHDKAHYHGGGAVILILGGQGYSLLWPKQWGTQPYQNGYGDRVVKVEWNEGSVFSPPTDWFHQHFNNGATRMRFIAFHFSQQGVKFWESHSGQGLKVSLRQGGTEIDYEDQDPEIVAQFKRSLADVGVPYIEPL